MGDGWRWGKPLQGWAKRTGRLGLFLSAYAPLSLIFALRSLPNNFSEWTLSAVVPSAIWVLVAVLGVLYIVFALKLAQDVTGLDRTFSNVQDRGAEVAGYVATYLLPFLTWTANGWPDRLAFAVYFIVIFAIFCQSNMSLVNPTLYVIRWQVFGAQVTGATNGQAIVISRHRPPDGRLRVASLGGGVYVTSPRKGKEGEECQLWIGE